jgi:hypothetical protein
MKKNTLDIKLCATIPLTSTTTTTTTLSFPHHSSLPCKR